MSDAPSLPAATEMEEGALRSKAMRRSWVCPGAGFALLGRRAPAILTCLTSLATLGAFTWLTIDPGAAPLWTALGLLVVAAAFWVAEQITVKRRTPQSPKP